MSKWLTTILALILSVSGGVPSSHASQRQGLAQFSTEVTSDAVFIGQTYSFDIPEQGLLSFAVASLQQRRGVTRITLKNAEKQPMVTAVATYKGGELVVDFAFGLQVYQARLVDGQWQYIQRQLTVASNHQTLQTSAPGATAKQQKLNVKVTRYRSRQESLAHTPQAAQPENQTVRVLLAYDQSAADFHQGNIETELDQAMAFANDAYLASDAGIKLSWDYFHYPASFSINSSTGDSEQAQLLGNSNFRLRLISGEYDVVHVITANNNGSFGGIAYDSLFYPQDDYREYPISGGGKRGVYWSMTLASQVYGGYTIAHEIGHNLGLQHDRYTLAENANEGSGGDQYDGAIPYGYGDSDANFYTIMAYYEACSRGGAIGQCERTLLFSDPDQRVNGAAAGIAEGAADAADASRFLSLAFADFRTAWANYDLVEMARRSDGALTLSLPGNNQKKRFLLDGSCRAADYTQSLREYPGNVGAFYLSEVFDENASEVTVGDENVVEDYCVTVFAGQNDSKTGRINWQNRGQVVYFDNGQASAVTPIIQSFSASGMSYSLTVPASLENEQFVLMSPFLDCKSDGRNCIPFTPLTSLGDGIFQNFDRDALEQMVRAEVTGAGSERRVKLTFPNGEAGLQNFIRTAVMRDTPAQDNNRYRGSYAAVNSLFETQSMPLYLVAYDDNYRPQTAVKLQVNYSANADMAAAVSILDRRVDYDEGVRVRFLNSDPYMARFSINGERRRLTVNDTSELNVYRLTNLLDQQPSQDQSLLLSINDSDGALLSEARVTVNGEAAPEPTPEPTPSNGGSSGGHVGWFSLLGLLLLGWRRLRQPA